MIYLICQDWSNTSNNHAGIKYLCNQIQEMYPESYKTFHTYWLQGIYTGEIRVQLRYVLHSEKSRDW